MLLHYMHFADERTTCALLIFQCRRRVFQTSDPVVSRDLFCAIFWTPTNRMNTAVEAQIAARRDRIAGMPTKIQKTGIIGGTKLCGPRKLKIAR